MYRRIRRVTAGTGHREEHRRDQEEERQLAIAEGIARVDHEGDDHEVSRHEDGGGAGQQAEGDEKSSPELGERRKPCEEDGGRKAHPADHPDEALRGWDLPPPVREREGKTGEDPQDEETDVRDPGVVLYTEQHVFRLHGGPLA